MRLGLIRHFEVAFPPPKGWVSVAEMSKWIDDYEHAAVRQKPVDLGPRPWKHCISSTAQRAQTTARILYSGEIETTPLLCEPKLNQFKTGELKLPFFGWRWLLRAAWFGSHSSQIDVKRSFLANIETIADRLVEAPDDTLVVSHAGAMMMLRKALVRRGFKGPRFGIAECGRLYEFTRTR
jgi:broad specificity phosphatase PhoE